MLGLYDPDRSQALTLEGRDPVVGRVPGRHPASHAPAEGQARRGLADSHGDSDVADAWPTRSRDCWWLFPGAKWHQWEPAAAHSARPERRLAFGQAFNTVYDLQRRGRDCVAGRRFPFVAVRAACVIRGSFRRGAQGARRSDGDEPAVRGRAHADPHRHQGRSPHAAAGRPMSSSSPGAWRLQWARILAAARARPRRRTNGSRRCAEICKKHRGASLVIAGEQQSPAVHALAHAMNAALGNVGKTVMYTEPMEAHPVDQVASLVRTGQGSGCRRGDLLLILGGNPGLQRAGRIWISRPHQESGTAGPSGSQEDETSELCHWHSAHDALPGILERLPRTTMARSPSCSR